MSADIQVSFVNEEEANKYDCGICLEKLKNPVAICEDHLFCFECIEQLIQTEVFRLPFVKCPNCRIIIKICHLKRVKFVDRRMQELAVKCPNFEITPQKALYLQQQLNKTNHCNDNNNRNRNSSHQRARSRSRSRERTTHRYNLRSRDKKKAKKEKNNQEEEEQDEIKLCEWTGPWSDLQKHINQCQLQVIPCINCKQLILREDEGSHLIICELLPIQCRLCKKRCPRMHIDKHINKYCKARMVNCQHCHKRMQRGSLLLHVQKNCPEKHIVCSYHKFIEIGCTAQIKRKNLNKHIEKEIGKHLELLETSHSNLEHKFDSLFELQTNLNDIVNTQWQLIRPNLYDSI